MCACAFFNPEPSALSGCPRTAALPRLCGFGEEGLPGVVWHVRVLRGCRPIRCPCRACSVQAASCKLRAPFSPGLRIEV
eukprot:scaffold6198_cov107-Isochrysis_galbana.AAC.4